MVCELLKRNLNFRLWPRIYLCSIQLLNQTRPQDSTITYEPFPSLRGTFFPLPRLAASTCYQSHLVWLMMYHFSFSDHGPWVDLLTLKGNGVRRQGCWEGIIHALMSKICTLPAKAPDPLTSTPTHKETKRRCYPWNRKQVFAGNCLDLRLSLYPGCDVATPFQYKYAPFILPLLKTGCCSLQPLESF